MAKINKKILTNKSSSKSSSKSNDKVDKDLNLILDEASKITMNNLDFDKSFEEQGKILCDIKNLLSNKKSFTCNPIITKKLDDNNFNKEYQQFKKKYSTTTVPVLDKSNKKQKSKTRSKLANKQLSKKKISKKQSSKKQSTKKKFSKKQSSKKNNLNARYPVVIIKKHTPRKNVIYVE